MPLEHLPRYLVCSDSDKARATQCPIEGAKELRTRVHAGEDVAVEMEWESSAVQSNRDDLGLDILASAVSVTTLDRSSI